MRSPAGRAQLDGEAFLPLQSDGSSLIAVFLVQGNDLGHALMSAAGGGHTTVCSLLLDAGADVAAETPYVSAEMQ